MGLFKRKPKYLRYELQVNDGSGWKKYGDFAEYMEYEDIENPDAGSILKFYGVFEDLSNKKDGVGKKSLWEHEVPVPGGKKEKAGKEKPVEERLMEKIVEGADFSGLKPTKLSIPLGKTGGSLDFESPVLVPGGGGGEDGGYLVIDGNKYPTGNIPPLEFEGKLPAWMHPAAGAMIMSMFDKFGGMVSDAVGKGISKATGIKTKETPAEGFTKKEGKGEEPSEEPPDLVGDLDNLLAEGEEETKADGEEETKADAKEKKKKEDVS